MSTLIAQRYRVDDFLALINHSKFYAGEDEQTHTPVIMRLMDMEEAGLTKKIAGFFHNEQQVFPRLDHPGVLRVLASGIEGNTYYTAHEYVPFKTLDQVLHTQGRLDILTALRYGLELADVLSRLHHLGIIHCDVKPENVLVVGDSIKLMEFIISNHQLDGTYSTGTPFYMSPEALQGMPAAVERDIWALGVTLFELLAGQRPYTLPDRRDSPADMPELIVKIIREPVPSITTFCPDLPPRLLALLNWMLVKDPAHRLNSMRLVASELELIRAELQSQSPVLVAGHLLDGRYQLQSQIAAGAYGNVFRAADLHTGEVVAVKQLKPEVASQPEHLARFKREAAILAQLDHPNIVKVRTLVEVGTGWYLVMDYLEGGSLRQHLSRPIPSLRESLSMMLELTDALVRAHHLHVIHRDIKPENILLTATGQPRLTDFGLAHIESAEPLTQTGAVMGTAAYLAPEVLRGEAATKQSDVWSWGVTCYEMLTGTLPFQKDLLSQLVIAILQEPVPVLDRAVYPEKLVELVGGMLQRDPNQRIQSMREVASRIEQILVDLIP